MNLVKSIAAVTVTVLTLTGTASAADGVGGSERHDIFHEYKTYEEAEAAIRKHLDEEAENARRVPLSVDACRKITADDTLYHNIPANKFPPVDQPMPMLSGMFRGMMGIPWLQLVVTESREANDETAIQTGYPTLWFRVVDTARPIRYRLYDGRQLVVSVAGEGVHKQNAVKSFAADMNVYIYNAEGTPLMRTDIFHLPTDIFHLPDMPYQGTYEKVLRTIADAAQIPLPESSRDYALAQYLLQKAVLTDIPRK